MLLLVCKFKCGFLKAELGAAWGISGGSEHCYSHRRMTLALQVLTGKVEERESGWVGWLVKETRAELS